jgi:hypothetical protein
VVWWQILAALSITEGDDDSSSLSIDDIHRIFGIMDSTAHSPEVRCPLLPMCCDLPSPLPHPFLTRTIGGHCLQPQWVCVVATGEHVV